ncbi:MAG: DUF4830 domain-containing protein [Clostridia bacterium]|nr:DUF4830 domain-containing protein [Clostridia bacterium]
MFVLSVNSKTAKVIILAAVGIVAGIILARVSTATGDVSNMNGIVLKASDTKERVAFLSQFGWEVSEDPLEVAEVIIPTEFDETYKAYNDIQKKQGFDLEKYKGTRVKRWTYEIKNYLGYAGNSGCIRANILVCDGNVIGGDICSVELDGFMHGFKVKENAA